MMVVSALMEPMTVLEDPVVDLEACCTEVQVVVRQVVLVKVEDVSVCQVLSCLAQKSRLASQYS